MGARIVDVKKGSLSQVNGMRPGDELLSINGEKPRDIIDYELLCSEDELHVIFGRNGKEYAFRVENKDALGLGLRFETSLFDGLMRCRNNCIFCFVDQLPPGLRKSLKVKDDDYRLSFLYGNFITLTNLKDEDVERILVQRLSPLYVSLHTTDPRLHRLMVRPAGEDRAMERFKALLGGGIQLHVQIVLCPEYNDKAELYKTLSDLEEHEGVLSVGVVPVGLTAHREGLPELRGFKRSEVLAMVKNIEALQNEYLVKCGSPWVYLADEFYAGFGLRLPDASRYGDFPQLENGIGIVRRFLDSVDEAIKRRKEKAGRANGRRFIAVTGVLSAACVERAMAGVERSLGVNIDVVGVENSLFGPGVTVAGLVSGKDISRKLGRLGKSETVLVPDVMLNADGVFLDDLTPEDVARKCDAKVEVVPSEGTAFVERMMRSVG